MRFLRRLLLAALAVLCVGSWQGQSPADADAGALCDRLAASPYDDEAPVPGVPIQQVRYPEAIAACMSAVRSAPEQPRYMFQLGRAVYGSGEQRRGARILAEAALRGYPAAMMYLGSVFVSGHGMLRDLAVGFQWHLAAAEKGNLAAQSIVGLDYRLGRGVAVDMDRAKHWLAMAARRGDVAAQVNLADIYVAQNDVATAARWYLAAARNGDADAQFRLGSFYERGRGVAQDLSAALQWYGRAAAQGHGPAYLARKRLAGGQI